jgi:peptide/nickel transport system substrate-binding protein
LIETTLKQMESAVWYPALARRDYALGANLTAVGIDDPDALFYEQYKCGSTRNSTDYCNPEVDKMIDRQSVEPDQEKRRQLVWEIERRLTEESARPLIFFNRGGICWDPAVKNLTVMSNSIYNGWRMEDVWLDR